MYMTVMYICAWDKWKKKDKVWEEKWESYIEEKVEWDILEREKKRISLFPIQWSYKSNCLYRIRLPYFHKHLFDAINVIFDASITKEKTKMMLNISRGMDRSRKSIRQLGVIKFMSQLVMLLDASCYHIRI